MKTIGAFITWIAASFQIWCAITSAYYLVTTAFPLPHQPTTAHNIYLLAIALQTALPAVLILPGRLNFFNGRLVFDGVTSPVSLRAKISLVAAYITGAIGMLLDVKSLPGTELTQALYLAAWLILLTAIAATLTRPLFSSSPSTRSSKRKQQQQWQPRPGQNTAMPAGTGTGTRPLAAKLAATAFAPGNVRRRRGEGGRND